MKRFSGVIAFFVSLCVVLTTVFSGPNHAVWADSSIACQLESTAPLTTQKGTAKDLLGTDEKSQSADLKLSSPSTPDQNKLDSSKLDRVSADINASIDKKQKSGASNKIEIRLFKEGQ